MAVEREAKVVWEGDLMNGNGDLSTPTGALADTGVTFARRRGEPEGHTSPEELIAAAHAACYAMSLSGYLAKQETPPERLEVSAAVTVDQTDAGLRITTSKLKVAGKVPGLDQGAFEEAAQTAEGSCPVSNALRGNLDIEVEATLG